MTPYPTTTLAPAPLWKRGTLEFGPKVLFRKDDAFLDGLFAELFRSYRQLLNDQFDREIRQQTEGLVSSLDAIYAAQQAGTLTEQEARALAIATIKSDRYDDGKGYFFADDKQTGVCVAHATLGSKVEGKRRIDDQDENGDYYMRKIFAAAAESDAGGFSNFS